MPGILKEIWIEQIKENFYPDDSFLTASQDMSELVEYNKINLAEAGVDPNVLKNNTTYPVPVATRNDAPLEIVLNTFDTENTVVRNVEEKETSYNKMESVIRSHRNALRRRCAMEAAHNWAPNANSANTPVIAATGPIVNGFRSATFEDFLILEEQYRALDAPLDQLNLILSPRHMRDLRSQDLKLYKEVMADGKLFGFKVWNFSQTPYFTNTGTKKPFGSVPATTDSRASIAWLSSEVMRADGDVEMFVTLKSPTERGDVIGFQKRFAALPLRNKYMGAVYSPTS
ncbi:MAG: hypothetical protein N2747_00375 [Chitinophagaceae bacterium]|nr:hypothetical protein [Chitinophagaceae bacterium]